MPKRRDIVAVVLIVLPWTLLITVWHQTTIPPLLATQKGNSKLNCLTDICSSLKAFQHAFEHLLLLKVWLIKELDNIPDWILHLTLKPRLPPALWFGNTRTFPGQSWGIDPPAFTLGSPQTPPHREAPSRHPDQIPQLVFLHVEEQWLFSKLKCHLSAETYLVS